MPDAPFTPLSHNQRVVLDVVRRKGPLPRAAIAPETQLTQPWVHRLVEELLSSGWLLAGKPLKGGRGQPSVSISLARTAAYSVGISVETDHIQLCVADLACQVVAQRELTSPPPQRQDTLRLVNSALDEILHEHAIDRARVVGVGVAISGFFVNGGRQINAPEPLRDWSLIDLKPVLSEALGLPVSLLNDATAAAIGESLVGVGRWAKTFCYLSFLYGFGAGLIIDGKPYFGRHGNAGEVSLFVPDDSEQRPALRYLLKELQSHGVDVSSIEQIRQRFDPNWPGVDAWVARIQPQIDRTVNALAGLFDPEAIIFGGQLPPHAGASAHCADPLLAPTLRRPPGTPAPGALRSRKFGGRRRRCTAAPVGDFLCLKVPRAS